jgi:hypothetical protein
VSGIRAARFGVFHLRDTLMKLMKGLLVCVSSYVTIGAGFGFVLWLSYWQVIFKASCFDGFMPFLVTLLITTIIAWFGFLLRTLVWLPSLIYWWMVGEPSF